MSSRLERLQVDHIPWVVLLGVLLFYLIISKANVVLITAGGIAFLYVLGATYEPLARSLFFTTIMTVALSFASLFIGVIWFDKYRIIAVFAFILCIISLFTSYKLIINR